MRIKLFKNVTLIAVSLLFCIELNAQKIPSDAEIEKASEEDRFDAAQGLLDNKQFYQSLRIWKSLLKAHPENANFNYKAGICQLAVITGRKDAIDYLSKTAGKVSKNYNPIDFFEEKVPVDAMFYLGRAYHLDAQFDKAIASFTELKSKLNPKHILYKDIDKNIQWANNAKSMVANESKDLKIYNIGSTLNSEFEDYSPVLSLDENVLYFTSRRMRTDSTNSGLIIPSDGKYYEDIYVSYRDESGDFGSPKRVKFTDEDVDENEATISVSADGTVLYVYHDDEGDGNIYQSSALDTTYSALEKLGGDINSTSWETHCSLTPDGRTLYFVSDRPGGFGGRDIYRVVKLPNGEWSKALPLPAPINTPYDEDAPFIHPSGNTLYFSSNGPNGMGGFDIFFSRQDSANTFGAPTALNYPINTVDDDVFFVTNASGKRAYYSSSHEGGFGEKDIYVVELESAPSEPFAILKGYIRVQQGEKLPEDMSIFVTDVTEGGEPMEYKPRQADGGFVMSLKPCHEYLIDYHINGNSYHQDEYLVPCESDYQEFQKELFLNPLSFGTDSLSNNTSEDLNWTLLSNHIPVKRKDIIANYIDENGKVLFTEPVDQNGKFNFHKLPEGKPYIFELKSKDSKLCEELEIVLTDKSGKQIGVTKRDARCKYTYSKDNDVAINKTDTNKINNYVNNNIEVIPVSFEKFYTYNMKDIAKSEKQFNDFVDGVIVMIEKRGYAVISIEGSASKVPTTTFKTNDKLSRSRTSDAKTRLMEAIEAKGVDKKKLRFKSVNSLVQGPRYNNDFMENKANYEKYQYIKLWAK
jgi:tetratricopeptide (TPR) repeat protein